MNDSINGKNMSGNSANRRMTRPNQPSRRSEIRVQILDVLRRHHAYEHAYEMEELVRLCPSFTWNQVFLEVDRLSRTGELRLVPRRAGVYAVILPQQPAPVS